MDKNRFLRKRGPLSPPDDGLPSSIYSRISTTTSNDTKMARASTIIITSVEASTSRSMTNSDTWIFDDSSIRRERKWSSRPNREYAVTFDQWDILKTLIAKLHKQKPYLLGAVPCFKQPNHVNLMTVVECKECNPFSDAVGHNPLNFFQFLRVRLLIFQRF